VTRAPNSLFDHAPGNDREKPLSASIANAVQQMMLAAASMNLGTVSVSVREEVSRSLENFFQVPRPCGSLGGADWSRAQLAQSEARRSITAFTHSKSTITRSYDGFRHPCLAEELTQARSLGLSFRGEAEES